MRIGIDASTWRNGRGFGRFTRELVTAMLVHRADHDFTLFADAPLPEVATKVIVVPQGRPVTEAAVADGHRSPIDTLRFTGACWRHKLDVMFYPAVYSWFPTPPGLPSMVTFHDAIAEHFPSLIFPDRRARWLWTLKVRLARWQATRYLTVSAAAKSEIVQYLRIPPDRIDLTTEGPSPHFRPPDDDADRMRLRATACRLGLPPDARYFVYVGGFAPHKNVATLIRAFRQFSAAAAGDVHLLLVGDRGSHGFSSNIQDLDRAIAEPPALGANVHFTGFVDDSGLRDLMCGAIALVLPSLSEGFGLPAVEAMACGTPVLASTAGSLPEIVGDGGAFFPPHDPAALSTLMLQLLTDANRQRELQQRARRRAGNFTWQKAATMTLDALARCVERR